MKSFVLNTSLALKWFTTSPSEGVDTNVGEGAESKTDGSVVTQPDSCVAQKTGVEDLASRVSGDDVAAAEWGRLRRAIGLAVASLTAAALLVGTLSSPASAGATSVTVSPTTWTPASSQAFTLTLQVSGNLTYVGFWDLNSPRIWTLSRIGSNAGTFDDATDTLTCSTGVTYTSTLFDGWGNGAKGNVCYDDQDSSYFEIGMNNRDVTGTGTVVISVPAGLLTAPSTPGTTIFQAVANPECLHYRNTKDQVLILVSSPASPRKWVRIRVSDHRVRLHRFRRGIAIDDISL